MERSVRVADTDTLITIPAASGVLRVDMPGPGGRGREVYHCAPQTIGALLSGLESTAQITQPWIDLLGAATPGLAVAVKRDRVFVVVAFDARSRTVRHTYDEEEVGVIFNLPPTTWVLRYAADGPLQVSNLLVTRTRVTSVTDRVPCTYFPFGNAHNPLGAICWGNVTTRTLALSDPVAVDNLFFGSRFNGDLVDVRRFTCGEGSPPLEGTGDWIRYLVAHPTAPLTPIFSTTTFASVLTSILGGREE